MVDIIHIHTILGISNYQCLDCGGVNLCYCHDKEYPENICLCGYIASEGGCHCYNEEEHE
jgi:hypothetical protein